MDNPKDKYDVNFQEIKDWGFGGSLIDPESKPAHVEHFGFIKALLDVLEGMQDGDSIQISRIGKTFVMYKD